MKITCHKICLFSASQAQGQLSTQLNYTDIVISLYHISPFVNNFFNFFSDNVITTSLAVKTAMELKQGIMEVEYELKIISYDMLDSLVLGRISLPGLSVSAGSRGGAATGSATAAECLWFSTRFHCGVV